MEEAPGKNCVHTKNSKAFIIAAYICRIKLEYTV